jgi:hypothetical protein
VRTGSRAITAWENAPGQPKSAKRRSIATLVEDMRMTDLTDLAWYAASRAGKTPLDITEWREQVDIDVERDEQDDDEDAAGPTQVAR